MTAARGARWRERLRALAHHHLPRPARHLVRLLAVALVVEYLLVPQIAGSRNSWHLLLDASNGWLLAALAAEVLSLLTYGWLTREVLPPAGRPSYGRLLRIDLSTLAVSHVVPAGSAVGLGLGYQLLTDAGVGRVEAVSAKAIQAVGSAVVLNVLLWGALVASIAAHGFSPVYGPVALAGVLLMTGVGALTFALLRHERGVVRLLGRVADRLPWVSADTVVAAATSAATYLRHFGADRRVLVRTGALATVNWLTDAAALWMCVRAFGHTLGPSGLLVPYGIANVAAAIPLTPAGLGTVEAVLIPALVGFSTPRGVAILGVLAWRALNFLLPIPVGLLAYLSLPAGRRPDRERAAAEVG